MAEKFIVGSRFCRWLLYVPCRIKDYPGPTCRKIQTIIEGQCLQNSHARSWNPTAVFCVSIIQGRAPFVRFTALGRFWNRRTLRKEDQQVFDRLFEKAKLHVEAGSKTSRP